MHALSNAQEYRIRLLVTGDPTISISAVAAIVGIDRATVRRRFEAIGIKSQARAGRPRKVVVDAFPTVNEIMAKLRRQDLEERIRRQAHHCALLRRDPEALREERQAGTTLVVIKRRVVLGDPAYAAQVCAQVGAR